MTTPTSNPIPSNDVNDLKFNIEKIDQIVSSSDESYTDRFGVSRYTWEGALKNIAPLGKTYTTEQAAAAIISGEIPSGAKYYQWGDTDYSVADEYINNAGIPQATGKFFANGKEVLSSPNLIVNSRAADSDTLPVLFSFNTSLWTPASSAMAALGANQSVICPPRSSSSDASVNYVFQQDISFVSGESYIATEFLFIGVGDYIFTRVVPDAAATRVSNRVDNLGNGVSRVTTIWKINGVAANPATTIYWGCQQRDANNVSFEIAYPKIAISKRHIYAVGGDVTPADLANINGVVAPNIVYNSYGDSRYQMPRLRVGSVDWTAVSTISDTAVASALSTAGAVSCLIATPASTGYIDALVEPMVDETASPGMWGAAQYYVYVSPLNGANPKTEIQKSAVFFIDVDNGFTQITPTVIKRISTNLFLVRAVYQFTTKPRRIAMGVRQTSANSTQYVFGFFMGLSVQKIRDVMQSPARDTMLDERLDGNARNIAFNPSADPILQQQPLFGVSNAWTPVASLPTEVQMISQLGAKAALPALRAASGTRDALVNIPLDGVKAGDYVRVEFSVYVKSDVSVSTVLSSCTAFFWFGATFVQRTATIKEKITDNVYVMAYQYQFTSDAVRVYMGVRSTRTNTDYWVFNTKAASSSTPILKIANSLVRDPLLEARIDAKIAASGTETYPPLLSVNAPVTKAEDFILLPDQIFVPPSAPLLLQCPQLLMNWTADMGKFLDWSIRGTSPNGQPYSYETSRTLEIDPTKTGTAVSFGFHNRQKPNQWSRRDVALLRGPATLTAAKTIALIGDSLTNRGQVARVTTLLTAAGITVSQIGTMVQSEGGKGEGREGWAAAHFVGKRNVINGSTVVISSDNPSNTAKNPFLFEATAAQKTANPAMCFLNTGAVSEQSYADTQTGVFYTFDYRRYLDAQGVSDPDVVTIALAWNDQAAGQTPDMYIAQINYMVSQIKVACPNVRIAVAPYCHPYSSRAQWNATTSQYVRNVIGSFKGRQAEKLNIIPSWAIMPADTAWSSDGAAVVIDSQTGSYTDTRSDNIHWDQWGRQYMAYNCLYPFYIWACAQ